VCDFDFPRRLEPELMTTLEFVRGVAKEDECEPLFKEYKTCLTVCQRDIETRSRHSDAVLIHGLQKALKDKGIEDMIAEARADNKDNDVEFMKPNSGKW
jgi:hypothetical protein